MLERLRPKFAVVFIGLAIGPIALVSGIIGKFAWEAILHNNMLLQKQVANNVSNLVSTFIEERTNELALFLYLENFSLLTLNDQRDELNNLLFFQKLYQELILLDPAGVELVRVSRSQVFLDKELSSRAKSPAFLAPLTLKKAYRGPIRFDQSLREPFMCISLPLFDLHTGKILYVLVAELRLKNIWDFLAKDIPIDNEVYVIDDTGRIIAHRNPAVVLRQTVLRANELEGKSTGLSGQDVFRIKSSVQLDGLKMTVIAEQTVKKALEIPNKVFKVAIIVSCFSFLAAIILFWYLQKRIITPVELLSENTRKIGKGRFPAPLLIPGRDEISQLASAFNTMVTELENYNNQSKEFTEQLRDTNRELNVEKDRFTTVMDSLDAMVSVVNLKTCELVYANKHLQNVHGNALEQGECWKTTARNHTAPCQFLPNEKILDAAGNPSGTFVWEFFNSRDGKWYQCRDQAIRWPDGNLVRLEIATDISERKRGEEQLAESLREKETMLREIHHRVKNNMQVILSLLRIYSQQLADSKIKHIFDECRNRIIAMSLVHETLYHSDSLAHINLGIYLTKLCGNLHMAQGLTGQSVTVTDQQQGIFLDIDKSITVGLIVSELVTNAFKHGFKGNKETGRVEVKLQENGEGKVELSIADNGSGLPTDLDIFRLPSLGLQLVVSMVEQDLGGVITVNCEKGTHYTIQFAKAVELYDNGGNNGKQQNNDC